MHVAQNGVEVEFKGDEEVRFEGEWRDFRTASRWTGSGAGESFPQLRSCLPRPSCPERMRLRDLVGIYSA